MVGRFHDSGNAPVTLGNAELSVLGPLDASVTGRLARRLLALLALRAPSAVSTDEAIDVVWSGSPPATAPKALQNQIVQLRRALGEAAIETVHGGYRLALTTDAHLFERVAVTDPHAALALWRGSPWMDLDDHEPALADRARLEGVRLAAEEEAAALTLDVVTVERLVAEQPYRERRWCLLLHALYRAGRQVDALRAAQRARALLAEQVGCEPGPELRAMETAVARHDPALGAVTPAADEPLAAVALERGTIALRDRDPHEALRWLRLSGDSTDALIARGHAQLAAGEANGGRATLLAAAGQAEAAGERDRHADALCTLAFQTGVAPQHPDVRRSFDRLVERRSALDDRRRSLLLTATVLYRASSEPWQRLVPLAEEAHAFALRSADRRAGALALAASMLGMSRPHDAQRRLAAVELLASEFEDVEDDVLRWMTWWARRLSLLELGDPRQADVADEMIAAAAESRHAGDHWFAATWGQGASLLAGDLEAAEAEAASWASRMAAHDDAVVAAALVPLHLMTIRWMQGRLPELIPLLERLVEAVPWLAAGRSALALAHAEMGDRDEAIRVATPVITETGITTDLVSGMWPVVAVHLAHTAARLHHGVWLNALLTELEPVADRHAVFAGKNIGSFRHHIGVLHDARGDSERARQSFDAAAAAHAAAGARWWADASRSAAAAVTGAQEDREVVWKRRP